MIWVTRDDLKFVSKTIVIYSVKCLAKIHGLTYWQPCSWDHQRSCTPYAESWSGHPCINQVVFHNPLNMELVDKFLKGTRDDWCHVDSPVVPIVHRNPHFGERVDVGSLPWFWPSVKGEGEVPQASYIRFKYLSLISPFPIGDLVRTGGSFLQPFSYISDLSFAIF